MQANEVKASQASCEYRPLFKRRGGSMHPVKWALQMGFDTTDIILEKLGIRSRALQVVCGVPLAFIATIVWFGLFACLASLVLLALKAIFSLL